MTASPADPIATPDHVAGLLEVLDDGVYLLDADNTCTFVNEGICRLTGYAEEDLVGETPPMVLEEEALADLNATIADRLRETEEPVTVRRTLTITRADGERVPCEVNLVVLRTDEGDVRGTLGLVRDATDRRRREDLLGRLQETVQSLMQAPSRATVAEIVASTAVDSLGFDRAVVRLYDPDERTLEPAAAHDAREDVDPAPEATDLETGPTASTFTTGEPLHYEHVGEGVGDSEGADGVIGSAMYFPVGVHGTLELGASTPGAFDDVDRRIAGLLATHAAAASNRAKREREVRDAREHVTTIVDRIEGLVADTIEVLVGATTRTEVERGVCELLATTEPYACAWIARPDVRETGLDLAEFAGYADPPVDDVTIPLDGDDPGAVAHREGRSVLVDEATIDAADAGWLGAASEVGIRSSLAVPLAHRETGYGVLFVCAAEADAFDERETVVLEALGRAVANAVDAIESGRILETDEVIELSVAVGDETLLGRVAGATGASLASAGTMSDAGGGLRLFLTATGAPAGDVEAALGRDDAVTEVGLVADLGEESLFDVSVGDSVVTDLVDRGAVPKRVACAGGETRLTVEVPDERAAREAFAAVEDRHHNPTLVGYHEHERPVRTRQEFRAAVADRFTDRQETALRTAYHGGFFDWPRGADGDELAEGMDISRPTYHQHLRAAQRKVFEELFEADTAGGE